MRDDDRYKEMTIPHLVLLANSAKNDRNSYKIHDFLKH